MLSKFQAMSASATVSPVFIPSRTDDAIGPPFPKRGGSGAFFAAVQSLESAQLIGMRSLSLEILFDDAACCKWKCCEEGRKGSQERPCYRQEEEEAQEEGVFLHVYIYKMLKQVLLDTGISSKTISIMNSFVKDIFERIATEASRLSHYNKRSTITFREI